MARAAALGRAILGEESLRQRSYVQAHGTGTPQNRITESHILDETAKVFGIDRWAVSAVKSYMGHSIGVAAGDQLMSTLGIWHKGIIPGIHSIESIAGDVHQQNLDILTQYKTVDPAQLEMALVNAKGFGGNNATALVLSPEKTQQMLVAKQGQQAMFDWEGRQEATISRQTTYEDQSLKGETQPIYQFGDGVLSDDDLDYNDKAIKVPGFGEPVNLDLENPFWSL